MRKTHWYRSSVPPGVQLGDNSEARCYRPGGTPTARHVDTLMSHHSSACCAPRPWTSRDDNFSVAAAVYSMRMYPAGSPTTVRPKCLRKCRQLAWRPRPGPYAPALPPRRGQPSGSGSRRKHLGPASRLLPADGMAPTSAAYARIHQTCASCRGLLALVSWAAAQARTAAPHVAGALRPTEFPTEGGSPE